MKKILIAFLFLSINSIVFSQNSAFKTIRFQENSTDFYEKGEEQFEKWASNHKSKRNQQEINIHCLYKGDQKSKTYLLQRERSILISQFLDEIEIENQRIIFISTEDDLPPYMVGVSIDEIVIEMQTAKTEKIIATGISHLNESPQIKKRLEERVVYTDQETTLHLENGSIIDIPESAFETIDGQVYDGKVVMEITEILDYKSAYASNVSTMSDQGILESRGMIDIKAKTIMGEALKLRAGRALGVNLPVGAYDSDDIEGFNIYNAVEVKEGENINIEWKRTPQEIQVEERNTRKYAKFRWTKIPANVKAQMKIDRVELTEGLKKGRTKKELRQALRKYKIRSKKQNKKNKKKEFKKTYKGRDYSKIRRSALLGDANYYWEKFDESEYEVIRKQRFFSFRMLALGMLNVDRPVKVKYKKIEEDLLVHGARNSKVTIVFKDNFCMLNGKRKKDKSIFKNIPKGEEMIVFSARDNGEGKISFTKISLKSRAGKLTLPAPKLITKKAFSDFLDSIKVAS